MTVLAEIGAPDGPPADGVWIYFAQGEAGGPVKIGSARKIYARLTHLQMGNPDRLCLVGYFSAANRSAEAELHRRFGALCVRGEWFVPGAELAAFVKSLSRDGSGPVSR